MSHSHRVEHFDPRHLQSRYMRGKHGELDSGDEAGGEEEYEAEEEGERDGIRQGGGRRRRRRNNRSCAESAAALDLPLEKSLAAWWYTFSGAIFYCVLMQGAELTASLDPMVKSVYLATTGAFVEFVFSYYYPSVQINPFIIIIQFVDNLFHGNMKSFGISTVVFLHTWWLIIIGAVGSAAALWVTHLRTQDYGTVGGPGVNVLVSDYQILTAESVATFIYMCVRFWGMTKKHAIECEYASTDVTDENGKGTGETNVEKCHIEHHVNNFPIALSNAAGYFLASNYAFPISGATINIYRSAAASISSGFAHGVLQTFYAHMIGFGGASILYGLYCLLHKKFKCGQKHGYTRVARVESS